MDLLIKNPHCHQAYSDRILALICAPHHDESSERDAASERGEPIAHDRLSTLDRLATLNELTALDEFLRDDSAELTYFEREENERSTVHFGQLKLFISELQLLTRVKKEMGISSGLIVYAGAAEGHHIERLMTLFPGFRFHLYDPSSFCNRLLIISGDKCQLFFQPFTDEDAAKYSDEPNVIFISDIRTGLSSECVITDMGHQKRWIEIIRPMISMVKFRLPWDNKTTEYFDGDIQIQAYAPCTSTETRLIIKDVDSVKQYDNAKYEKQMSHHNCVGRISMFDHQVSGVQGLDQCFDCALLVKAAKNYLAAAANAAADATGAVSADVPPQEVAKFINETIKSFGLKKNIKSSVIRSTTRGRRAAAAAVN
jgi:hypothetical protein